MKWIGRVVALVLLFASVAATPAIAEVLPPARSQGFDVKRLARLDSMLNATVDAGVVPGIVGSVYRKGKPVYQIAVGWQSLETRTPLRPDSLFRIYSMTKPITAVAAMQLLEEGRLRLKDPIANYLPQMQALKVYASGEGERVETVGLQRPVTIHHLLTHTSGFSYSFMGTGPVQQLYTQRGIFPGAENPVFTGGTAQPLVDMNALIGALAAIPLLHQPGERFSYGVSMDVLGKIVEQVSGQALERVMQDRIFQPLGMRDTSFFVDDARLGRFMSNYSRQDGKLQLVDSPVDSQYRDRKRLLAGGAGLVSTVADYQRFALMMLNRGQLDGVRVLGAKTVDFMLLDHLASIAADASGNEGQGFGLGFSILRDPAASGLLGSEGEASWSGAASTTFWIDAKEQITAVFMTQVLPPDRTTTWQRDLRTLVYQALTD